MWLSHENYRDLLLSADPGCKKHQCQTCFKETTCCQTQGERRHRWSFFITHFNGMQIVAITRTLVQLVNGLKAEWQPWII